MWSLKRIIEDLQGVCAAHHGGVLSDEIRIHSAKCNGNPLIECVQFLKGNCKVIQVPLNSQNDGSSLNWDRKGPDKDVFVEILHSKIIVILRWSLTCSTCQVGKCYRGPKS